MFAPDGKYPGFGDFERIFVIRFNPSLKELSRNGRKDKDQKREDSSKFIYQDTEFFKKIDEWKNLEMYKKMIAILCDTDELPDYIAAYIVQFKKQKNDLFEKIIEKLRILFDESGIGRLNLIESASCEGDGGVFDEIQDTICQNIEGKLHKVLLQNLSILRKKISES